MVYFILDRATRAVKIGYTGDIEKRRRDLQVGSAYRLELLGTIAGDRQTEGLLHWRFSDLRLHGDWFRATDELLDAVRDILGDSRLMASDTDTPPRKAIPAPDPATSAAYRAVVRPIEIRVGAAVGFPVSFAWGSEPHISGAEGRRFSYQVMPAVGHDFGDQPSADFWWWYIDAPQWFADPERAGHAFIAGWKAWNKIHSQPITP